MARKKISKITASAVRRRARFKCEAEDCSRLTLKQFAHIIPDADKGDIDVNNILWLCESCHRLFEVKGKSGLIRESLIESLKSFRDRPKYDSLIDGSFEELLAHPEKPVNIIMGSVGFINPSTIFSEPPESYKASFLKVTRNRYKLEFRGLIKNINGFTLIEFDGINMHFHTKDIWDIERSARYLKIYSKAMDIWIELKQEDNLDITINGAIYAGGALTTINKEAGIRFGQSGGFHNLSFDTSLSENSTVLALPASPIPRPYGHVIPNVI